MRQPLLSPLWLHDDVIVTRTVWAPVTLFVAAVPPVSVLV